MRLKITILPGDGIGPEVIAGTLRVLECIAETYGHELSLTQEDIGGAALRAANDPLPKQTVQSCLTSDAVLMGAVGSPEFDSYPPQLRPEAGLLRLRKKLGAFANLRPAKC